MQTHLKKITPFLWFDKQAEEAANFYTSIFNNSKITRVVRYRATTPSGNKIGDVMTVAFQLDGLDFVALNGGPHFKFNEAVSFVVNCATQQEIDHYWEKLSAGGDPAAQQCGWLKDKYGVSWQIVPAELSDLLSDPDPEKAARATRAMMQMKKLDIEGLRQSTKT
ncbi:MAG TPA: VOC family protein [Spongiibacteraceae bacterium]|jgi:predicted 3-demethylubiquinone-9 3-methyltransferase (glyoxalase superfamily)